MGLAGAGYGASLALEGILEQALKEKALEQRREIELAQIQQRKDEADAQAEHQRRLINLDEIRSKREEREGQVAADQRSEQRRAFDNVAGLGAMGVDPDTARREGVVTLGRAGVVNPQALVNTAFHEDETPKPLQYTYTDPRTGAKSLRTIRLEEIGPAGVDLGREPQKPEKADKPQIFNIGNGTLVDSTGKVIFQSPPSAGGPSPYAQERAARTLQSVDELLGKVNKWTVGYGSTLAYLPETDARNFKAELDTLKANVAFNELTQMREASKTGGALGSVAVREMELLQSALGALDQAQSPENFASQLKKIKSSIDRWQTATGQPAPRAPESAAAPPSAAGTSRVDDLLKKYGKR